LGGEQGLSLTAWYLRGKTWIFHALNIPPFTRSLTALPGGKNLPTGQVAHAGGGKWYNTIKK